MNKHVESTGRFARCAAGLGLLACLLAWSCCGCSQNQSPSPAMEGAPAAPPPPPTQAPVCTACEARARAQAQAAASAATAPPAATTRPVAMVTGERAQVDLGDVKPGAKHQVVFAIRNDSDKPLNFIKVRGDCSCITAAAPPQSIPAGQETRVVVIFDPPDVNATYGAELIMMTDDPQRKIIRLAVSANIHR